jgi:hypothetical protein
MHGAKQRGERDGHGCDITLEYLTNLWHIQGGICPFSGLQLSLPINSNDWKCSMILRASLDRINNALGYFPGNVRFISRIANYMRNSFSDDQVIDFCIAVSLNSYKQNTTINTSIINPPIGSLKWFLYRLKNHQSKGYCDLDVAYLAKIWAEQSGICLLTGKPLIVPIKVSGPQSYAWPHGRYPLNASLDRIDNAIGYIRGNVRFISLMSNYGRSTLSDLEFIEFCKAVANYHPTKLNDFK